MRQPKLSIIIPAYQEAVRIEKSLDQLAAYLRKQQDSDTEVLVVVADSPDGTAALARSKAKLFHRFRVVEAGPRKGKGRDVRVGMMEARGHYRLFMDADLATPLHHIAEVRKYAAAGVPVIIAVRNLANTHNFGLRKLISSIGNRILRLVLLPNIRDTQCGFKAFSAEAASELFGRQRVLGWGFDMEILAIAKQRGYKIAQIPVADWKDQPNGTFEGAVIRAALITLAELVGILWRRWTGGYRRKSFTYRPYRP
ncbi:MAG TPA: glycosyltransferase [Candidatus Saccharimonadales bacterium]|nr:glycosyltransferase [Candidatus Saccharimonadales bacterium]